MKIPNSIWTLLVGILLTLVSLWYGQNHGLLPVAASKEAFLIDGLFNTMMVVSTGIFILVEGILIYAAIRYRRAPGDETDGQPVHGNVPLEILWTAIPAIIVFGISVYSFDIYNEMGGFDPHGGHDAPQAMKTHGSAMAATMNHDHPVAEIGKAEVVSLNQVAQIDPTPEKTDKPGDLKINVAGLQYAFIFSYPDAGISSGELHVPVGREVNLNMAANDVIHAFWVPEFRLKQDLIPGRETKISFTPLVEGEYTLICAELCGPYHGAMRSSVIVESPEKYDKWVQEQVVASAETMNQTVALNPTTPFANQFLAHYTHEMGIEPEVLHQVHH